MITITLNTARFVAKGNMLAAEVFSENQKTQLKSRLTRISRKGEQMRNLKNKKELLKDVLLTLTLLVLLFAIFAPMALQ